MKKILNAATLCYLFKDDKVLFLKFNKKWGQVYCPPGGKLKDGESMAEGMIREFKEETGLTLLNPKLKGLSYWNWIDEKYGLIYVFVAHEYKGNLVKKCSEGELEWIEINNIPLLKQFPQNQLFNKYVFEDEIFECHFKLNEDDSVKEYRVRKI